MKLFFWIILLLLCINKAQWVSGAVTLLVDDFGVQTVTVVSFGSNAEEHIFEVLLNSPDIALVDQQCTNIYGVCKEHCKNDVFCAIYCSPMCCIPANVRKSRCDDDVHREGYSHNSSTFKILDEYWRSPYDLAVGVWVMDEVHFEESETDIGRTKFALKVVSSLYRDELIATMHGELGLGRHPKKRNILLTMYDRGIIEQPVLTMVYARNTVAKYIFGEFNKEFCHPQRQSVDAVGLHEWMFDATAAEFFDYKSPKHPFRIILRSTGFVHMPRSLLFSFLETQLLHVDDRFHNYYVLNDSAPHDNFAFSFNVTNDLTLNFSLKSVDIIVFPAFGGRYMFQFASLDPNPDNVEWIIGRPLFLHYCTFLDYKDNKIWFSQHKR